MPTTLTLTDFVEHLLNEKHKGVVIPPENRAQMKNELTAALNKMISLKMLEQLTSEELVEFQHLADTGVTDDKLQQYVGDHVGPKLKQKDVFLAGILNEFRDLYLTKP